MKRHFSAFLNCRNGCKVNFLVLLYNKKVNWESNCDVTGSIGCFRLSVSEDDPGKRGRATSGLATSSSPSRFPPPLSESLDDYDCINLQIVSIYIEIFHKNFDSRAQSYWNRFSNLLSVQVFQVLVKKTECGNEMPYLFLLK